MNQRKIILKANTKRTPCPKCGNNTEFMAYSDYCAEDCCEVWVVCKCGYEATDASERFEDVWGGVNDENVFIALDCWDYAIEDHGVAQDKGE